MNVMAANLRRMLGFVLLGLLAVVLIAKIGGVSGASASGGTAVPVAASGPVTANANEALANSMLAKTSMNGPGQALCLDELWTHESGFNAYAANSTSNARGIPQSISGWSANYQPGNARQQIAWGLSYIGGRYGSPCKAWNFEMSHTPNWY